VRHADPSALTISLIYDETTLQLQIEDDGKGFVADADSAGFGIRGMRKRADTISAELRIRSVLGQGTTVLAIAPMPAKFIRTFWPTSVWHLFWERRFHGQATNKDTNSPTYRR
jgi:glucose-6-phosphate-specific signal transduction histidine kinase